MQTIIKIQNLKCGGCAATILKNLKSQNNIQEVLVDVENSEVKIFYDNPEALTEAKNILSKLGYPELGSQNSLFTKSKSYLSCAVGKLNT